MFFSVIHSDIMFATGRHAQLVAFEKSDLMFVCMLKPLSTEITIDEKEIEDAKVTDSSFHI